MGLKPSIEVVEKERLMTPGPGQYSPTKVDKKAAPAFVIGTEQRLDFTTRKTAKMEPGPGNYNPDDKFVKTKPQAWVMGTEKQRPGSINKSPGPGHYDPSSEFKH